MTLATSGTIFFCIQSGKVNSMRKSILQAPAVTGPIDSPGLNLEEIAQIELSSEDAQYPFEHALRSTLDGWKASTAGPQVIRVLFDHPQSISRIQLQFCERSRERSQEFAIFATSAGQRRNVVRQQWTFSPDHSPVENEEYTVNLSAVSVLELEIDPGRHDKQAFATLQFIALSA
jgi:hypothetical protein